LQITDSTNGGNANNTRNFAGSYTSGTYYLGFLLRANRTSGAFQANLRLQNNGTDIARIGVHNDVIGLANSGGTVTGNHTDADGGTHFYLVKLTLNPAGNDTLDLFLDPAPGSTEPVTPFSTLVGGGEFSFNGFRIFNNPGSSTTTIVDFDELRLATTWAAVVNP
jgi:hypothetical protein